jgi:hypothetical protein
LLLSVIFVIFDPLHLTFYHFAVRSTAFAPRARLLFPMRESSWSRDSFFFGRLLPLRC